MFLLKNSTKLPSAALAGQEVVRQSSTVVMATTRRGQLGDFILHSKSLVSFSKAPLSSKIVRRLLCLMCLCFVLGTLALSL